MLGQNRTIAFVATEKPAEAKVFYRDTLGLRLITEDGLASIFDANEVMLRLVTVRERAIVPYTVLGWEVRGIEGVVLKMTGNGIAFEQYAGLDQDEHGVWTAPGGAKVAWFKDPDGNLLSLSEHPALSAD